jgi:hypothetical protein
MNEQKNTDTDSTFYIFDFQTGLSLLRIWQQRKTIFNIISGRFLALLEWAKKDQKLNEGIFELFADQLLYLEKGFPKKDLLLPKIKFAIEAF